MRVEQRERMPLRVCISVCVGQRVADAQLQHDDERECVVVIVSVAECVRCCVVDELWLCDCVAER